MTKREEELSYYKKLNKTDLLARTMGYYDAVQNYLQLIHELRAEHKAEIRGLTESYQSGAAETEETYNKSHCYKYVKALLSDLVMTKEDLESTRESLEYAQKNGYEDLINENQALRNKIVRMA